MRARVKSLFLSLWLFAAMGAQAQETKKPLTNGQVVKLVQAEIPDETIILVIEHSKTHFDTSPAGLVALRNDGVSKIVIAAMLNGGSNAPSPQRIPTANVPSQNLSDEFAKAGLKALRSIQGTLATPGVSGASITVPRAVQDLIDDADADARTDKEKAVVGVLNKFFLGRLMNNLQREIMKPGSYSPESELRAQKALENNPQYTDLNAREVACSGALDNILRSREFSETPAACDEVNPPSAARTPPAN